MRTKMYSVLGLNVPTQVFTSPDEYNAAAKRPNEDACVEDANDNLAYRGTNADAREEFCLALEKATGVARTKVAVLLKDGSPKLDDEKQPVFAWADPDRTEADYFRRVVAVMNHSVESFQDLMDSVAAAHENKDSQDNVVSYGFVVDPTVRERKPAGPKTLPKSVYTLVDELIAKGVAAQTAAGLSKVLGRTVESDRESLARATHEYRLAEIKKINAGIPGVTS